MRGRVDEPQDSLRSICCRVGCRVRGADRAAPCMWDAEHAYCLGGLRVDNGGGASGAGPQLKHLLLPDAVSHPQSHTSRRQPRLLPQHAPSQPISSAHRGLAAALCRVSPEGCRRRSSRAPGVAAGRPCAAVARWFRWLCRPPSGRPRRRRKCPRVSLHSSSAPVHPRQRSRLVVVLSWARRCSAWRAVGAEPAQRRRSLLASRPQRTALHTRR
jgi:hypothetical protein